MRPQLAIGRSPVVFDMETQDPDDFLTLLLLLGHPDVDLRAVTITPGSRWQVGLVRKALAWFDRDIPVGARMIEHEKKCVSSWHYRAYGDAEPSSNAAPAAHVLFECCKDDTTLVTGAPVKNLGDACAMPGFRLGRWVAQGGFAGEGVVPAELQLPKFAGKSTMATFNLGGAPTAALAALAHPGIGERRFVSKNVCHRVVYDETFHEHVGAHKSGALSLEKIWLGMEAYLEPKRGRMKNEAIQAETVMLVDDGSRSVLTREEALERAARLDRDLVVVASHVDPPVCRLVERSDEPVQYGKKLHDPLAACCAIDERIGTWAEVELYRKKGKWGARLAPASGTWIIIDYDAERFRQTFVRTSST